MNITLSKTFNTIFLFALFLITACSNENESTNPINDDYISIPDNHFETKLIEQGIDTDGVVNQQMLKTDAEKVTRLDLNLSANFGEISDLTGIEGFVNLTLLSAANQKIQTVDLSFNTKLDTIYMIGNYLKTIDLSKNINLIFADLQANEFDSSNSIIGLSNATGLKDLDLSWNYLEEFNIHNESLEVLHISHNDLKSIDTDGAVNLKHLLLTSNKLETVDFSTNTAIETLLISDNQLPTLNLEYNSNLTHLYISSNMLSSFDVSNNYKLVDLRIDRNPDLTCIKVYNGQKIPTIHKSDTQELSLICN
ncbi:hypothetical protein [Hwangdonia lutea]|uniref:Uncharacterized protein n=1 Tax=Hwangdonia lutea TaxID=3075823 RepID=A0AA97ENZ1_9FLAO|nr:hypothetical protein [Hwangdonia sp. SCSIO 19198]WOD43555.1 hypothetical protein RNZ46_16320 [Hwangdonia sp. SCSIO 19198]